MSKTPVRLHQVGDNVTQGKEVKTEVKNMMMNAEAKRRLIMTSKVKK